MINKNHKNPPDSEMLIQKDPGQERPQDLASNTIKTEPTEVGTVGTPATEATDDVTTTAAMETAEEHSLCKTPSHTQNTSEEKDKSTDAADEPEVTATTDVHSADSDTKDTSVEKVSEPVQDNSKVEGDDNDETPFEDRVPERHSFADSFCRDPRNYVQIGCLLFLIQWVPDAFGHLSRVLLPWTYAQLKRDFAGQLGMMSMIPRYIGIGCYPANLPWEYQQEVNGHFNSFAPPLWYPVPGEWPTTHAMLEHIFGEQLEEGLDYLTLLYTKPTQNLPILVLVSKERETGKTTFLNLLKEIYGLNMAFVTNESMRSKFNAERAGKLIIGCDETLLNKKEDSEAIKSLSTAKKTYLENKGKDRVEIDNCCKIILCSNNINDPVYIDREENRYWVREVRHLKVNNPNILEAMKREIPAFLDALLRRPLHLPQAKTRMWFDTRDLATPALLRIVQVCRPTPELELAETLLDIMDRFEVDELEYTNTDLTYILHQARKFSLEAHRIVAKQWCVPHASNKLAYKFYDPANTASPVSQYGRYYTFNREFLETLLPQTPEVPEEQGGVATTGDLFGEAPSPTT